MAVALALVCSVPLQSASQLAVNGVHFTTADGRRLQWRGITAFRLAELVAHGHEREADAYLAWAASKKLTLVRVLTMAGVLFQLSPGDGERALPRLLGMAQRHGLCVEVVALADTATVSVDMRRHVAAIGEICGSHPNCLVEIVNEPGHPTQAPTVGDPVFVKSLAALIPAGVPVSFGSIDGGAGFGAGSYVTWHAPRSSRWPEEIAAGAAALLKQFDKPVVNDEPIGAADKAVPGRRDNEPAHFRDAGGASRRAGIGATFHYEGGLQAKIPSAIEMACLDAWLAGLTGSGSRLTSQQEDRGNRVRLRAGSREPSSVEGGAASCGSRSQRTGGA